jgi:hypothetical protein
MKGTPSRRLASRVDIEAEASCHLPRAGIPFLVQVTLSA